MERPNLPSTESRDTLISLQELEPSPIDSPSDPNKEFPGPETGNSPSPGIDSPGQQGPGISKTHSNPLGLSRGGHGAVYYLSRIHRYSSYTFTLFTTLHLANTSLIPLLTHSLPASDSALLLTREIYQTPLTEPLLIALPLVAHILAGITLRIHRRNETLHRYGASHLPWLQRLKQHIHVWPPLSPISLSGYLLAPLLAAHMYVNRILPLQVSGGSSDIGLGYVAHGFARHPAVAWGFYAALIATASAHVVWGWGKWMGWLVGGVAETRSPALRKKVRRRWWVLDGVVVLVAGVWAAGGLGVVARAGMGEGWVGKAWDGLYDAVPFVKL